jgi:hypothetical protein
LRTRDNHRIRGIRRRHHIRGNHHSHRIRGLAARRQEILPGRRDGRWRG